MIPSNPSGIPPLSVSYTTPSVCYVPAASPQPLRTTSNAPETGAPPSPQALRNPNQNDTSNTGKTKINILNLSLQVPSRNHIIIPSKLQPITLHFTARQAHTVTRTARYTRQTPRARRTRPGRTRGWLRNPFTKDVNVVHTPKRLPSVHVYPTLGHAVGCIRSYRTSWTEFRTSLHPQRRGCRNQARPFGKALDETDRSNAATAVTVFPAE
ncbi:unnamed protein product [Ectocarpus sp. 6 AP-2014]